MKFDPTTTVSSEYGIFGLPFTEEEAKVVLVPVPWEVTTSYGAGTSLGPALIRQASEQIDLFDLETGKAYENGYHMQAQQEWLLKLNNEMKKKAQKLIGMVTDLSDDTKKMDEIRKEVNEASDKMSQWVYENCLSLLKKGKVVGLVGGDHSTPLGNLRAHSEYYKGQDWAVLHIDAHADLRKAYQGFTQSHASIMYNLMTSDFKPTKLVQLGIRDFCEEEFDFIQSRDDIKTYFDLDIKKHLLQGQTWHEFCGSLVHELPKNVYLSFDIDGLDPVYCPRTGTPVIGGLSVDQVFYLFSQLAEAGKKIIGFDLNEVSTGGLPLDEADEWDGNVGARILYKMCGWAMKTRSHP
ncbi:MAG: agmatinase family protein [Bdellovibrionota bacterium]